MGTRRSFLANILLAGVSAGLAGGPLRAQSLVTEQPQEPKNRPDVQPDSPLPPGAEKKILEGNDKDMKKKVDQLYQLASELKEEVDKTDSSKVFSLKLVKKAEEIERLAREIKNRSKG